MLQFTKRFFQVSHTRTFCSVKKYNSVREEILALKNGYGNVPEKILELTDRKLYQNPQHPLGILATQLGDFFGNPDVHKSDLQDKYKIPYTVTKALSPIVTVQGNFDDLLVPSDHVSRKRSDNYYITENLLLRAHTSAHQTEFIRRGEKAFINIADVYRRDTIDSTHYPCFHQVILDFYTTPHLLTN